MVQWLRLRACTARGTDSFLVKELRSHMLHSVAKKKKYLDNQNYQAGNFSLSRVICMLVIMSNVERLSSHPT